MAENTDSITTPQTDDVRTTDSTAVTRYRVFELESPEQEWAAFGVAFEGRGEILLWYPPMRGPIPLAVRNLSDLTTEHIPLKRGVCRWSEEIEQCPAPIELAHVLESHRTASEERPTGESVKSKSPGPESDAAGQPSHDAPTQPRAEQRKEPSMSVHPRRDISTSYAEDKFAEREAMHHREKRCIAEYTAWWLRMNWADSAIAIDGGTTNEEIVKAVCRDARERPPTVGKIISNNLMALQIIGTYIEEGRSPAAEATGGTLRGSRKTLLGSRAAKSLEDAFFDAAVVGANGFYLPFLATVTTAEHQVKQKMIELGTHIVFPIDAFKWGLPTGSQLVSLTDLAQLGKRAYLVTSYPLLERAETRDAYGLRLGRFKRNADALIRHWIKKYHVEGIKLLIATVQLPIATNVAPCQELEPRVIESEELRGVDYFQERFSKDFPAESEERVSDDAELAVSIAFELHDPGAVAH